MAKTSELKHRVSRASVEALSGHIEAFNADFPRKDFVRRATRGLAALELKARIQHVADALASSLPREFEQAATIIDGANALHHAPANSAFVFWPLATYVETYGLAHPDRALQTMHGLTALASCEFAIRPYIEREPARVFSVLRRWVKDPNHHVRRLVSEGTRPRLPWGARLSGLQADPSPLLPLLDKLVNDDELYVRRSVANHLNDISKDHPELAVATAARWRQANPCAEVDWVIRHALRGMVKAGHAGALALQGIGRPRIELASFTISPARLRFGDALDLNLQLRAKASHGLLIDYAVHHMKANGELTPKVFKWTRKQVNKGELLALQKQHSIRAISTRRYHAGLHRVELLVNGQSFGVEEFELVGPC